MNRVDSLDQYKALLAEAQKKAEKRLVTNSYMFTKDIQRYIDLGRLYYEELEGGIAFYSDEDSHYRCYLHADPAGSVKIGKKDKLVLAQVLYRKEKTARELGVTSKLASAGFYMNDIMDYITVDYSQGLKKIAPLVKYIHGLLDEGRLVCRTVSPSELNQFVEFQNHIDNIPYYQLTYHSPEEYALAIQEGRAECVVDQNGNICAVHYFDVENGNLGGWYAIKEEYQKAYGIVMLFSYSAMKYAEKNNIKNVYGWVLRNNTESIKYHKKLGFVWQTRVMEEWVLGN